MRLSRMNDPTVEYLLLMDWTLVLEIFMEGVGPGLVLTSPDRRSRRREVLGPCTTRERRQTDDRAWWAKNIGLKISEGDKPVEYCKETVWAK